jgi:hypothetical protein
MLAQQRFHHLRHRHVLEQAGGATVLQQGQARADVEGIQGFFPAAAAALRLTHHAVPAALSCQIAEQWRETGNGKRRCGGLRRDGEGNRLADQRGEGEVAVWQCHRHAEVVGLSSAS